jgi:cyclopropane-fatty-acyl-phospholipid synthase
MSLIDRLLETNLLPDFLIRIGIRRLLRQTLQEKLSGGTDARQAALQEHIAGLKSSPIAVQTAAANQQHYEVPTRFYQLCLGKRLKYSCGYWDRDVGTLDQAEERMLALTCARAELADTQHILELGCGWGSLSLWMAEHYPNARITGVSNSRTQKEHIDAEAKRRGLNNLTILTADMNVFETADRFDRVVSVEMFEHMKNYEALLKKVCSWLHPGGKLFVHIFTHREVAYHYEDRDASDWMTRYFFAGGQMPSDDLLLYFQDHLRIERHWTVSGTHYAQTAEAWLQKMDAHRSEIWPLFSQTYGTNATQRWWVYWRVFFMACAELWNFHEGEEWIVSHYLFVKPQAAQDGAPQP